MSLGLVHSKSFEGRACPKCSGETENLFCACILQILNQKSCSYAVRTFKPGAVIAMEGYKAPFFGSIITGVAAQEISLADGRVQGVSLLRPPDVIGNHLQETSKYSVTALSNLEIFCVSSELFDSLLRELPELRLRFLNMKLGDLERARNWLTVLGRRSSTERLAYLIVRVAQKIGFDASLPGTNELRVNLPITRERIGSFLGMSTETVSREFTHLERAGILSARNSRVITIFNYRRLEIAAGIDDDGGTIH
ncbi:Crp/Fnr family transcriptional regulator [Lutimaribacter saemankumensis]|uniref:CRP/FNR family transcriptional regulator, anaerobic regulatory protein n=1 Tax=Lutimaribacter saemankumensis TaxID=490829 RepID=A0A1G8T5F5_9RHOB|nr:Crp/Fnr family transcriptional regulator [Lutimaribacter saemankumensis]SDJ35910.1 CRP/FNR family transcriptional regulator, anaerobic regulatory protein [Lutimaribacter saemankumensis]